MTSPINLDVWNTVFAGTAGPGPMWLAADNHHPSMAGHAALLTAVAAAMPDPGGRPVYAIGDSWLTLIGSGLQSTLEAAYGHPVTYTGADYNGMNLNSQLAGWWNTLPAHEAPAYVIHYSGFVHESQNQGGGQAFALANVRRLVNLTAFCGARLVALGVAPIPAPDDATSAALYPLVNTALS